MFVFSSFRRPKTCKDSSRQWSGVAEADRRPAMGRISRLVVLLLLPLLVPAASALARSSHASGGAAMVKESDPSGIVNAPESGSVFHRAHERSRVRPET